MSDKHPTTNGNGLFLAIIIIMVLMLGGPYLFSLTL
jgi:hypothetical protein